MNTTCLKYCSCKSEYQDARYSKGLRVHNLTRQSAPPAKQSWRCTVCGNEKGQ